MEMVVALWSLRLALVGAAAVTLASLLAGSPLLDAIDRGLLAAVAFTFAGGWLLDRLEPPGQRLQRARARLASGGTKPSKEKSKETRKGVTA